MIETAFILSTALLLMFGGLQIGLAGYYQVATDGAVYMAAHDYALGGTNPNVLSAPFPGVDMRKVVFSPAPPDPLKEPVDYDYTNQDSRYGGVSTIRPEHLQASYSSFVTGLLNIGGFKVMPVSAGAVEGRDWTANHDMNVDGYDPNSGATYSSMQNSLYTDDQNVPPYYIGWHYVEYCDVNNFASATQCNSDQYLSLGVGELLDSDNYSSGTNGVTKGSTFYGMLCHQQIYATLLTSGALPATIPSVPSGNDIYDPMNSASPFAVIYGWDRVLDGGYSPGHVKPGLYPMHPLRGCP